MNKNYNLSMKKGLHLSIVFFSFLFQLPLLYSQNCLPVYQYNSDGNMITRVVFGTIDNTSPFTSGRTPSYEDFKSVSTNVTAGNTYTLQVKGPSSTFPSDVLAQFDWNQNGEFEASESIYIGLLGDANPANARTISKDIVIPSSALTGNCVMRIIKNTNLAAYSDPAAPSSITGACGESLRAGQVEEYTLVVEGNTTPNPTDYCSPEIVEDSYSLPIYDFNFNGTANTSSNATNASPSYENFTNVNLYAQKGNSYPVSIKGKTDGQETVLACVYIDLNQDFVFSETEKFEIGFLNNTGGENGEINGTVQIPSTALTGSTRMRVVSMYHNPSSTMGTFINTPCPTSWFLGQLEDYTLHISDAGTGTPCTNQVPGNNPGDIGCITVTENGISRVYGTVRAADGNIWLQQNLGSAQIAQASNDAAAYGDLYQWGRSTDGHQLRNSQLETTPLAVNNPTGLTTSSFITTSPRWWEQGSSDDKWEASSPAEVSATNGLNPCAVMLGQDWKIPTEQQWMDVKEAESITNITSAFESNLKLVAGGTRNNSGDFDFVGARALYWSSTISTSNLSYAKTYYISSAISNPSAGYYKQSGNSVRCIYSPVAPIQSSIEITTENNVAAAISVNQGTLQLQASILPATMDQSVTWSLTNNPGLATISSTGLVSALQNGTVRAVAVSVADNSLQATLDITISNQYTAAVSLTVSTENNVPAVIGQLQGTLQLVATILPAAASQQVNWTVRNINGNASVTASGLVKGLNAGQVWVIATAQENPAMKDSIKVTIAPESGLGLENPDPSTFIVYPNPVEQTLFIDCSTFTEAFTVELCDLQGKLIYKSDASPVQKEGIVSVNVEHLAEGNYILRVYTPSFTAQRFISKF